MKAVYVLWPNYEYLDKLVDAGIDTLLVTAHDLPFDQPSNYYDSRDCVVETIHRYRDRCQIFLVPLWCQPWKGIHVDHRWQTREGKLLRRTPCPTSKGYVWSRVLPVISFARSHGCSGIIWDLEHLEQDKPDIIPFYKTKQPKERCCCIICNHYNTEDLWKVHAGLIREQLRQSGIPNHGQMPYSYGWTMRQYPGQVWHFTEETYKKDISCWEHLKWKHSWRKYKVDPILVPGIWCEFHSDELRLINYIKKLYKKYGHFWLYSHEYFGNRIPNPHVSYPMPGPATDWFFKELAKI